MLGLRFCARAFSICGKRGPLLIAVRGPLTIVASFVAEHGLQTRRLSSCGSRAHLLRGMWDLPRPGPVSPALAGRLSTTAPPGKPCIAFLNLKCYYCCSCFIDEKLSAHNEVEWLLGITQPESGDPRFKTRESDSRSPINYFAILALN